MIYPQSKANKLSKNIDQIAKNGCLAMCYLFCIGLEGSEMDYIDNVSTAIDFGYLKGDCTVYDADKYLGFFAGEGRYKVLKKNISSIAEIKERTPVCYEYGKNQHWVVVENGKIVFNSLANSQCVTRGKPTQARIITLRG